MTDVMLYGATVIGHNSNRELKRLKDAIRRHLASFDPISIYPCFTFVLLKDNKTVATE